MRMKCKALSVRAGMRAYFTFLLKAAHFLERIRKGTAWPCSYPRFANVSFMGCDMRSPMRRGLLRIIGVLCCLILAGQHSLAGQAAGDTARVSVRIEVRDAAGRPAKVSLQLAQKRGRDARRSESNRYGLAFASLLAGSDYAVTVGDFKAFATIRVPKSAPNGYQVKLQLPPDKMRGKTASEGRGLVLFTYLDANGQPNVSVELRCNDGAGKVYTAKTNANGIARVEVPLGATYWFSVDGYANFESHTFASSPLLQTTEIRLQETKEGTQKTRKQSPSGPTAKPKYSVYESAMRTQPALMRNRADSVTRARRVMRQAVRQKRRAQYALPARGTKPTPKVTKQVMNGVYLLRQALIEEERENPKLLKERQPIISQLTRNGWDSMVLVVDVTCSMDPYVEEYLLWTTLARNDERLVGCVFFNDGDGREDSVKVLGATGGVRHAAPRLKSMVDTLVKCISYGCSGSSDENDVEALLYAQQVYPHAKRLVLIADNTSAVRDLELADGLLKPVHVLLCDPQPVPVPHADYVTIAYLTRGSVHLLNDDFELARRTGNKQLLRVGKWEYQYVKDRWTRKE